MYKARNVGLTDKGEIFEAIRAGLRVCVVSLTGSERELTIGKVNRGGHVVENALKLKNTDQLLFPILTEDEPENVRIYDVVDLQPGEVWLDRNGEEQPPMERNTSDDPRPFASGGCLFHADGSFYLGKFRSSCDLVKYVRTEEVKPEAGKGYELCTKEQAEEYCYVSNHGKGFSYWKGIERCDHFEWLPYFFRRKKRIVAKEFALSFGGKVIAKGPAEINFKIPFPPVWESVIGKDFSLPSVAKPCDDCAHDYKAKAKKQPCAYCVKLPGCHGAMLADGQGCDRFKEGQPYEFKQGEMVYVDESGRLAKAKKGTVKPCKDCGGRPYCGILERDIDCPILEEKAKNYISKTAQLDGGFISDGVVDLPTYTEGGTIYFDSQNGVAFTLTEALDFPEFVCYLDKDRNQTGARHCCLPGDKAVAGIPAYVRMKV